MTIVKDIYKDIFKTEMKTSEYPNGTIRTRKLTLGDILYIADCNTVKIGGKFKDYPAIINQIYYEPKKWWQFWKHKKQIGYSVRWL